MNLLTDEERNDMFELINYMTKDAFSNFGDLEVFESCSSDLFFQFFDIFASEDLLYTADRIDREVIDNWLVEKAEEFGGIEREVLQIS